MADAPITLKAFFCDDEHRPIADCLDASALVRAAHDAASSLPTQAGPRIAKAFHGALDGLFEPRLDALLQRSWSKLVAVQEALKVTAADAAAVVVVPILDHRIASSHAPHIDLMLGQKSLGRFAFDITLALELRGIELEVRRGRICALRAGECAGEGVFGFAGQTLIKKKTPPFALPGRLAFEPEP